MYMQVRRLITLIDVLYDHKVKLLCSAAAEPFHLFKSEKGAAQVSMCVHIHVPGEMNLYMCVQQSHAERTRVYSSMHVHQDEAFAFDRTASRLKDMMSEEYKAMPHQPPSALAMEGDRGMQRPLVELRDTALGPAEVVGCRVFA